MKKLQMRKVEAFVFLLIFGLIFYLLSSKMGISNLLNTVMNTSFELLTNTVFYIMGITVLSGAFGQLMIEFGVVRLLEYLLAPFMKPIFNLPGVAALGGLMTFFSDNPAIISLARDKNFKKYFKNYELISLTNFGTAFGMGLIVITFMSTLRISSDSTTTFFIPALIGFFGAIVGAAVSTRIMQRLIKDNIVPRENRDFDGHEEKISFKSDEGVFLRFINSILDGGKSGVETGLSIIPGVLVISTFIMMITFDAGSTGIYDGSAYQGVPILPFLAGKISFVFDWLFGFKNPELIAFPITSLGAVGAALSLVKKFIAENMITGNEIAVFTAMGMCWSGYLSTHTAMLDALKYRELTSKALLSHTIGGIAAGVSAHYGFLLISHFFEI